MTLKAVAITGGGGGGISGSGGSPYVARWSGATSLTTGVLVDTGTRVGILQTSPVSTFQVGGNTVATASPVGAFCTLGSDSRFTADDGTRAVTIAANGTNAIIGTTTAHDLLVQTNGATKLFVQNSTGRIGVGNTDPATLLETYGTSGIRASSDTIANIGVFQYSSDVTPATLTLRKARGTRAAQATVATSDQLGSVNFTAYGGTSGSTLSSIAANVVTYTSNANISSNLTFGTSASGAATPTTRLTIDEAGVSTFTGPVRATGTAASAPAFTGSDTDTGMYFPANNQVRLSTAGSVAVAVDASQNVGVQNANPSYPLHVGGGNNTGIVTTGPAAYVATNGATSLVVRDATNGIESFLYAGSSVVLAGAASAHSYHIRTNNVSRLIVSATTGIVTVGATAGATADTLDVSTAGWGVKLATTPGNGNGNTLDCYEEGTWTPVDRSGASLSFTAVSGTYTRIGRTVIAQCTLTYPSTANASDASFSLPIAMTTANTNFGGATIGSAGALAKNNVTALIKTGAAPATDHRIALITYNGAGSVTNANMSLVTIIVSVCYNVA